MAIFAKSFQNLSNNERRYIRDLGYCKSNKGNTRVAGNVKIDILDKEGPGKRFYIDVAICANNSANKPSYTFFDAAVYSCQYQIQVHNSVNGQWRVLRDWANLGVVKPRTLAMDSCWGTVSGLSKPAYGFISYGWTPFTPSGVSMSQSAGTVYSICSGQKSPIGPDGYASSPTFFAGELVGVRYLSLNGWHSSSQQYRPSQVGNLQAWRDFPKTTYDNTNCGRMGPIIDFTAGQGDDRWQINLRLYRDLWNDYYEWSIFEGELINKIDNPLMGYPDVKKVGQDADGWPPRYDAQFYIRSNGKWVSQKENQNLQGQRKDGSWKVF